MHFNHADFKCVELGYLVNFVLRLRCAQCSFFCNDIEQTTILFHHSPWNNNKICTLFK